MNSLFIIGLLVAAGYIAGLLAEKAGIPKIIGYILTGIVFSPNTIHWIPGPFLTSTDTLLQVSLAFIAFEVGGELKWSVLKKQENKILLITLFEALFPVILIAASFIVLFFIFPGLFPIAEMQAAIAFSILLASLASPTDPASTLAIVRQYRAKGPVKDTILAVAAHDDALGILIFSLALATATAIVGDNKFAACPVIFFVQHLGGGFLAGAFFAYLMILFLTYLPKISEGHWIILIFALLALCYGTASIMHGDEVLACMVMAIIVVNTGAKSRIIFQIISRYTEELIFLFFFVLSGLHLNIHTIPETIFPIIIYIILRIAGKFSGSHLGARLTKAGKNVQLYTGGGLIPQGGIVIGLTLIIGQYEEFAPIFNLLLTIIMGTTLINEIIGPFSAKLALRKAGEINLDE